MVQVGALPLHFLFVLIFTAYAFSPQLTCFLFLYCQRAVLECPSSILNADSSCWGLFSLGVTQTRGSSGILCCLLTHSLVLLKHQLIAKGSETAPCAAPAHAARPQGLPACGSMAKSY